LGTPRKADPSGDRETCLESFLMILQRAIRIHLLAAVFCTGIAGAAIGQTDLSRFPLSRAIPADVFVAVAARGNAERAFLDEHWHRVFKAFHDSGILDDIWEMISDAMDEEQLEQVEEIKTRFTDLCGKVEWHHLFEKEMIHASRYVAPVSGSIYEGIFMGRMSREQVAANYSALKSILEEVVRLVEAHGHKGDIAVTEQERDGYDMAVLGPTKAPGIGLVVAARGDVIALAFGPAIVEECMALLSEKSQSRGLVSTDRFKSAFGKLPPAEDSIFFFDPNEMLGKLRGFVNMAVRQSARNHRRTAAARAERRAKETPEADESDEADAADDEESEDEAPRPAPRPRRPRRGPQPQEPAGESEAPGEDDAQQWIGMLQKLFDEVSVFDYIAAVEWTEGRRVFSESRVTLLPEARSRLLYSVFAGVRPVSNFERLVPKEAGSFSCSSGIDLVALYRGVRGFVEDHVPGGKEKLAEFDELQKNEWELDIERDILSLFTGGMVQVEMGDDWVLMLQVTDEEKAGREVSRWVDRLREAAGGEEGGLMLSPVEITGGRKFTRASHPMLMMAGGLSPVVGCAGGYLIIGSSTRAIDRCLKTAAGEHANITRNPRWGAEGLKPAAGDLDSISFTDQSKTAENLQAAIGGVSMAMSFVGMAGGQDAPPPVRAILTKLPTLLTKLGPVAGKLDFFLSSAEYSTFKDGVWHTRGVQNYKPPRPAGEEDEADADDEDEKPRAPRPRKAPKKPAHQEDEDE
jgi:hypothetical protein